jgi:hypothetical protein
MMVRGLHFKRFASPFQNLVSEPRLNIDESFVRTLCIGMYIQVSRAIENVHFDSSAFENKSRINTILLLDILRFSFI